MTQTTLIIILGIFCFFEIIEDVIFFCLLKANNIDRKTFVDFMVNGKSYAHCEECPWFCNDFNCPNRNNKFDCELLNEAFQKIHQNNN